MEVLPSYIRGSKRFLQVFESLPLLPENIILVTADVTSLYTNIPHKEGIESVLHYMKFHANRFLKSPHNLNTTSKLPKEQQPVIRGQVFSPTHQYIHGSQNRFTIPKPFHGLPQRTHPGSLHLGHPFLEGIHRQNLPDLSRYYQTAPVNERLHEPPSSTIQFNLELSTQEISFQDMKIHTGTDRKLSTALYRKPTDCAAILHFHSNHSLKCKESVSFHKPSDTTSSLQITL